MDGRGNRRGRFRGNASQKRANPRTALRSHLPRQYHPLLAGDDTTMPSQHDVVQLVFATVVLGLAGDAAPQAGRALGLDRRLRAPLGDLDDARVEQVQAVEEARDYRAGADRKSVV